jgi:dihydroneopterin aldolase
MQIILKDVVLFGYHGVHALERKVGTQFRINILIDLHRPDPIKQLEDTVDYATIFAILKTEFQKTESILEVLLERLMVAFKSFCHGVASIDISIVKINPPIAGFQGEVGVRLKKEFT